RRYTGRMSKFTWVLVAGFLALPLFADECADRIARAIDPPHTVPLQYDFDAVRTASLVDPTHSTGATLFYFPTGARVNFDARGGAVATVETTLLEEGSYSNEVNAIL